MQNGLLGLGGFGGIGGGMPPGILSKYYDPAELKKQQMKQALIGAGIGLLSQEPSQTPIGFGETLGAGMRGGLLGAQQAGQDYQQNALLAADFADKAEDRAYKKSEYAYKMEERTKQSNAEAKRAKDLAFVRSQIPPEDLPLFDVDPDSYAKAKLTAQFAAQKNGAPKVDSFYNEQGLPYKAQWNEQTQTWDKIGGAKAPDNGITMSPDGTVQIGGTKSTEGDRRAALLANQSITQEQSIMQTFDSLASGQNTVGNAVPGGRAMMTPDGQLAQDAISNVVGNWLYLLSGATATAEEVAKRTAEVLPTALDAPEVIAAKKARLQSMFDGMRARAGIPAPQATPSTPPGMGGGANLKQKYGLE
jgi:hypothetical protein